MLVCVKWKKLKAAPELQASARRLVCACVCGVGVGVYCVEFNVGRLEKVRVREEEILLLPPPAAVSCAVGTDLFFFFFSCAVLEFPSCSRFCASACERVRRRALKTRGPALMHFNTLHPRNCNLRAAARRVRGASLWRLRATAMCPVHAHLTQADKACLQI